MIKPDMANLLVLVSYRVFPAHMGGQKGVVLFYQCLKKYCAINMLVSRDNEPGNTSYPVSTVLYANNHILLNLLLLPYLCNYIRQKRIQCIIAEHSYTGWIAWLLKRVTGIPFIIHSHNNEASRFRQMGRRTWRAYSYYERWIHRKADFNFFKTEEERQIAIRQYGLKTDSCAVIPYGIGKTDKICYATEKVKSLYSITSKHLFYFNGTLDYEPNSLALEKIVEEINPRLLAAGIDFTILISGKKMSASLQTKIDTAGTVRYLGFVEDANLLYQASSLFLNPVINNSGVKTKVVEAIANDCTVISTRSGATGIPLSCCHDKLLLAEDGNWQEFVDKISSSLLRKNSQTPERFYDYFAWESIAKNAAGYIEKISHHG